MGNEEAELASVRITLSRSETETAEKRISYGKGSGFFFFNDTEGFSMLVARGDRTRGEREARIE